MTSKLLDKRLRERADESQAGFVKVKEKMSERGVPNSSITIQEIRRAAKTEIEHRTQLIADTILEEQASASLKAKNDALLLYAKISLTQSVADLQAQAHRAVGLIANGPMKQREYDEMLDFSGLRDANLIELEASLIRSWMEKERELGKTVFDRLVNRAKNHPVVAWSMLAFMLLMAVLGIIQTIMAIL